MRPAAWLLGHRICPHGTWTGCTQVRCSQPPHLRFEHEHGSALVTVLTITALLGVLIVGLVVGTMTLNTVSARADRDRVLSSLLDGAIEDYLYRLNTPTPGAYLQYAHTIQPGCVTGQNQAKLDPTNPYMDGLAPLPGVDTTTQNAVVGYEIDQSELCATGIIAVTAHARLGPEELDHSKKMRYLLRRQSFSDYTYFTDFETLNPERYDPNVFDVENIKDMCARHFYDPSISGQPPPRPESALGQDPGCSSISWMTNDWVEGHVHSNDAFIVCGTPEFPGKITTGWAGDGVKHYIENTDPECGNAPKFSGNQKQKHCGGANDPCHSNVLSMPTNPYSLKTVPGVCVYTGPTFIDFIAKTDRIAVRSDYTPFTAQCGGGAYKEIPFPTSGLIYVQNIPQNQIDSGTITECKIPANGTQPQNVLGYPRMDSGGTAQDITPYGCHDGDAIVQGTFHGNLTVVSENRLIIRQNISKPDLNSVLGLIGNNGIEIYHPVTPDGKNMPGLPVVTGIEASLLALNDSISVQNYDQGSHLGVLQVWGSFAQKWRGAIGTTDGKHGYFKQWRYDPVLKNMSPPFFLTPVNGTYHVDRKDAF